MKNVTCKLTLVIGFIVFLGYNPMARAQEYVPGEVIIKLKGQQGTSSSSKTFAKLSKLYKVKRSFSKINMHELQLKSGESVESAVNTLKQDPDVAYAEPNYILKKIQEESEDGSSDNANGSANDAENESAGSNEAQEQAFANQVEGQSFSRDTIVAYQSTQSFKQIRADVELDQAWQKMSTLTNNNQKPIVAVIDSGLDIQHSVFTLSQAVWSNQVEINGQAGVDDDGNGYIDDIHGWDFVTGNAQMKDEEGHGTHVAGSVLGAGENIFEANLEEAKIQIMPLRFLDANGSGSTSNAISAIYYAVDNGARVINNSWGGASYSQALLDALTFAYNHQVLIVTAAGNNASNNDVKPMYPASYNIPSNLTVAATNDYDYLASFSNYGAQSVHLASPGVSILSTIPGNAYAYMSGTSMATPFVAGMAALILREAPQLTGYQVKDLLLSTAMPFSQLSGKVSTGSRINSNSAISTAQSKLGVLAYQPQYSENRAPSSESSSKGAGGCGLVQYAKNNSGISGFAFGLLISLPIYVLVSYRKHLYNRSPRNRRKYDRYVMNSFVKLSVGGRELMGQVNTVSVGGISFDADEMLEKGGAVQMQILGPDGKQTIQVDGRIVWNEENKKYGVQFSETKETVKSVIEGWTQKLVKC